MLEHRDDVKVVHPNILWVCMAQNDVQYVIIGKKEKESKLVTISTK